MQTRLPAKLLSHYGQPLKIWLLARLWDSSFARWGWNLGQGKTEFNLKEAAKALGVGVSTVRRYLAKAKAAGLLRFFKTSSDEAVVYYSSLEKVARAAGLEELGAIGEITLDDLKPGQLAIAATEITTQHQQRQSFWAAKEEKENKKLKRKPLKAELLFSPPCGNLARVIGRNKGILYVSEGFITYGASQESVARQRGVSTRTVQRHLSNLYRTQPSPVRGHRSELGFCYKVQLAQRVRRGITPKIASLAGFEEDAARLIHGPHNRMFYLGCNIYYPDRELVRARYRRRAMNDKGSLSVEKLRDSRQNDVIAYKEKLSKEAVLNDSKPKESSNDAATPQGNRRQK